MLKAIEKPARFAGLWVLCVALAVLAAPIRDSAAAEGDRRLRMAKFVRPVGVPFPPENPYSPEKAELGRMLFFDP